MLELAHHVSVKSIIVRVLVAYGDKKESWYFKFVGSQIPHLHGTVMIDDRRSYRETQWPEPELSTNLIDSRACDSIVPVPGKQVFGYTAFLYIRYKATLTPALLSLYEQPVRTQRSRVALFVNKIQQEFKEHGRELSRVDLGQRRLRRFVADCEADLLKWWGKSVLDEELASCGLRLQVDL